MPANWTCTVGWVTPCLTSQQLGRSESCGGRWCCRGTQLFSWLCLGVFPTSMFCWLGQKNTTAFSGDEVALWVSFFSVHVSVSPHVAALICVAIESLILVAHSHEAISCRNALTLSWHCWCQHKTKAFVSKLSHKPSLENSELKLLQTDANLRSPYIPQNNKSKLF